jgi:predicted amino acid-binding ACT domain protein
MPTVYLISHSVDAVKDRTGQAYHGYAKALLKVPRHALQLSSVDCSSFKCPPLGNGRWHRNLSPLLGEICMQDVKAQKAVEDTVSEAREVMGQGAKTMLIEVECEGDSRRSMAVAEVLKEELESVGVDVEIEHVRGG